MRSQIWYELIIWHLGKQDHLHLGGQQYCSQVYPIQACSLSTYIPQARFQSKKFAKRSMNDGSTPSNCPGFVEDHVQKGCHASSYLKVRGACPNFWLSFVCSFFMVFYLYLASLTPSSRHVSLYLEYVKPTRTSHLISIEHSTKTCHWYRFGQSSKKNGPTFLLGSSSFSCTGKHHIWSDF